MTVAKSSGPIILDDGIQRSQFTENGHVVLFRREMRTVGETWIRKSFTSSKLADGYVHYIGGFATDSSALEDFVVATGYMNARAWRESIRGRDDSPAITGHLYYVRKLEEPYCTCGDPSPTDQLDLEGKINCNVCGGEVPSGTMEVPDLP